MNLLSGAITFCLTGVQSVFPIKIVDVPLMLMCDKIFLHIHLTFSHRLGTAKYYYPLAYDLFFY